MSPAATVVLLRLGERQKKVALSLRERKAHLAERDAYIRVTYLLPHALPHVDLVRKL